MNKGDTVHIVLNYKLNDVDLEKDAYDEIELQLNSQLGSNSVKLLMTNGDITWDETTSKYVADLSQAQTFKLKDGNLDEANDVSYQLRILLNGTVGSQEDLGTFTLGPVLSRKVLEVDE